MEKQFSRILILIALLVFVVGGYFFFQQIKKSSDAESAKKTDAEKERFNRELQKWTDNILLWANGDGPVEGVEQWYWTWAGIGRTMTPAQARQEAYYMMKVQGTFVPTGWYIDKISGSWDLFQE